MRTYNFEELPSPGPGLLAYSFRGLRVLIGLDGTRRWMQVAHEARLPHLEEVMAARYTFFPEDVHAVLFLPNQEVYETLSRIEGVSKVFHLHEVHEGEYQPHRVQIYKTT